MPQSKFLGVSEQVLVLRDVGCAFEANSKPKLFLSLAKSVNIVESARLLRSEVVAEVTVSKYIHFILILYSRPNN